MLKTKTYPHLVTKVKAVLYNGSVLHHPATPDNPMGQSGLHTFITDILNITKEYSDPQEQWYAMHFYMEGKTAKQITEEIEKRRL